MKAGKKSEKKNSEVNGSASGNMQASQQGPSLHSVLVQALEGKDIEGLRFVLSNTEPGVIESTLDQLNDERHLKALVDDFAFRLNNFPSQSGPVLRWIEVFLRQKHEVLRNFPELLEPLRARTQFFEIKESSYAQLLRLKGKIAFALDTQRPAVDPEKRFSQRFGPPRVLVDEREAASTSNGQDEGKKASDFGQKGSRKARGGIKGSDADRDQFDEQLERYEEEIMGLEEENDDLDEAEDDLMMDQEEPSDENLDRERAYLEDDEEEGLDIEQSDNDMLEEEEEEEEERPKRGKSSKSSSGRKPSASNRGRRGA